MNLTRHRRTVFSICGAGWVAAIISLAGCHKTPDSHVAATPGDAPGQQPQLAAPAPITIRFADVTARAGINFHHNNGAFGLRLIPESVGSGAAFLDYNNDHYPDIFFVNGRDWSDAEIKAYENSKWSLSELAYYRSLGGPLKRRIPPRPSRHRTTGALYRNNRDGTFSDVTRSASLDVEICGMGAAVGDYDNDGRDDLYVTGWPRNWLFHNNGNGTFADVTMVAGVQDNGWSTSAGWVDYDRDGRLDLFVCHYVKWSPQTDVFGTTNGEIGAKSYVGPLQYKGDLNRLYHNDGQGRFHDVSVPSGIQYQNTGGSRRKLESKSLGVALCDPNSDGWPDLFVANDMMPNYLLENQRNGTFKEVAGKVGLALSRAGKPRAGMGIDFADIDHSGRESLVIGNFDSQMLGLYHNRGGAFVDVAPDGEVGRASRNFLTFGLSFCDLDNDTWPDIFVANGHVQDDIEKFNKRGVKQAQRPLVFRNLGNLQFQEIGLQSGSAMRQTIVARGLACADIDLDGDVDVLLTANGGRPMLLRNDSPHTNHALRLTLSGTRSNRSAVGARLEAKIGPQTLGFTLRSSSSYCSQNELPLTLGLGSHKSIDRLTISWPSGRKETYRGIQTGQNITIREGSGIVRHERLHTSLLTDDAPKLSSR